MMKTIGFSNRERIEMGEKVDVFIDFLAKKLPQPDYETCDSEAHVEPAMKVMEVALFEQDSKEAMIRKVKEMKRCKNDANQGSVKV